MQLKISKILNQLLLVLIAAAALLMFFYFRLVRTDPAANRGYFIFAFAADLILLLLFKWLESSWDKTVINKMAAAGKIALANLTSYSRVMELRDSNFRRYWLYEFHADAFLPDGRKLELKFWDKMNHDTETIPLGSVYITFDEAKPAQIFLVPNALIACLPQLMPTVQKFESDRAIQIKYLDVLYNRGMVIRSFGESVAEAREQAAAKANKNEKEKQK